MQHSRANLKDSRLETEKRRTFKGSALINLDVLHFSSNEHRDLDPKHVEYLKGCFQKDRCRRFEEQNHIQAIIDQPSLDNALRHSDVSPHELLTNKPNGCPKLIFPRGFKLRCLHGQHRIAAAREFLLPHDKLWTIDLFTSDLDDNLKQCLHEQYLNEQKPSDGEAYCKIRYYHFQRDVESENQWRARLRGCRLKNLKELLVDREITAGFDALLDIPGVWDGMRMTTLQSMMAMGCKDEILHYLACIKNGLLALVGGDKLALTKLDQVTVKALELRAPGASTVDAQFLRTQIRGGAIFTAFTSYERDRILDRLPMVDGMILTLFSFFNDLNYLHLLINCLRRLVDVSKRGSVCEAIQRKYTGVNQREEQVKIQVSEEAFIYKTGTDAARIDLGCRSLIALAMRYYPYMPRDPVKEDTVMKATTKADQAILGRFADLAYQQGFKTSQILTLREYPSSRIAPDVDPSLPPLHVTSGRGIDIRRRSGIPRRRVYEEDRYSLFINHLHDTKLYQGEGITSFFVRKHVYLAFFGRPVTDHGTTIYSSPNSRSGSGSPHSSIGASFNQQQRHSVSQSQGASELSDEDINDIIYSYDRGEHTLEQERLERERQESDNPGEEGFERETLEKETPERDTPEREAPEREGLERENLELRRLEETLERDDLNERFAQGLQAQEKLKQEKRREQEQKRREQEKEEEDQRRQETRQQRRREEEAQVYGRSLRDYERTKRRHTLLDMESIDNARQETTSSEPQSGQELVIADQSSDSIRRLRNAVVDHSSEEQERVEQEETEQERREKEAQVQGRALKDSERKKNRHTQLDLERLEQERLEQGRLEQERLEQERLEQERLNQERLDQERLERLNQERLEQERLVQERLDQERLKQERLEQERLEHERLEQERLEQQRLEQQRLEQRNRELSMRKAQGKQRERGRLEQEKAIESKRNLVAQISPVRPRKGQGSTLLPQPRESICITFKIWERGVWRTTQSLFGSSSDSSEVERMAVKQMRKQIRIYDTDLNILTPQMCFRAAIANRANILLLIPESKTDINEELEASVSQLLSDLDSQVESRIE